jgi:hypothetical protein
VVSADWELSNKLIEAKVIESCSQVSFPTSRLSIIKSRSPNKDHAAQSWSRVCNANSLQFTFRLEKNVCENYFRCV